MNLKKLILFSLMYCFVGDSSAEENYRVLRKEVMHGIPTTFVTGTTSNDLQDKNEDLIKYLMPKERHWCFGKIYDDKLSKTLREKLITYSKTPLTIKKEERIVMIDELRKEKFPIELKSYFDEEFNYLNSNNYYFIATTNEIKIKIEEMSKRDKGYVWDCYFRKDISTIKEFNYRERNCIQGRAEEFFKIKNPTQKFHQLIMPYIKSQICLDSTRPMD